MNEPVEVECSFESDGLVRIRRVRLAGRWRTVDQGRQWADDTGRHVLVLLPGGVRELVLRADSLTWELRELPGRAVV